MTSTQDLLAQAAAMLKQTQAEGTKPFAGSSYDTSPPAYVPPPVVTPTYVNPNANYFNQPAIDPVLANFNQSLIPAVAPKVETSLDAGAMKDVPQVQSPVGTIPNTSNSIFDKTSVFATVPQTPEEKRKDEITKSIVDKGAGVATELAQKKAQNETLYDKFTNFINNRPSQETLLNQGKAQFDVAGKFADIETLTGEVGSLREQLATLDAESSAAVSSIEGQGRGIPLGILALQKDKVERAYNSRKSAVSAMLGAKSANIAALQGNLSLARNLINETIDAKMNDSNQKIQDFKDLYSFNKDIINSLSTDQKDALNAEYKRLTEKTDIQRQDLQKVGQLMVDNPKAGVSIDDTVEEAVQKVQRAGGSISARSEARIANTSTEDDGGFKFTSTQINKGVANSGLTKEVFNTLDGETKNILINSPGVGKLFRIIKGIETGIEDADAVISEIDEATMPESTREYLRARAEEARAIKNKSAPAPKASLWSKIKGIFTTTE